MSRAIINILDFFRKNERELNITLNEEWYCTGELVEICYFERQTVVRSRSFYDFFYGLDYPYYYKYDKKENRDYYIDELIRYIGIIQIKLSQLLSRLKLRVLRLRYLLFHSRRKKHKDNTQQMCKAITEDKPYSRNKLLTK